MPLYEFVCTECKEQFESLVASSKWEGRVACPHCGSRKVSKELSVFASAMGSGSTGPMPCDTGSCAMPPRQRKHSSGCGCCRARH